MKKVKSFLIVLLRVTFITIVLSFCMLEILMRTLTVTTSDGITLYRGMAIRPLNVPISTIERKLTPYLEDDSDAIFRYHPQLGWLFTPNLVNDQVTINEIGLRSNVNYSTTPDEDVTRIAIFGDSFVAGGEVGDESTIPYLLENSLRECGAQVEVMNFGVFGYGMDQAYLLWQVLGRDYHPDVVIFGFQPENINRNVNLARPIANISGIPFTKPRFLLDAEGNLELINSPTVPLESLMELYQNFEDWEFAPYEWYFNERYTYQWNDFSILYRVYEARQNVDLWSRITISPDEERTQVTSAIIEAFAGDVVEAGQEFVILHLPNQPELRPYVARGRFGYQFLIDDLASQYPFIHSEAVFRAIDQADWQASLHYSPTANQRIADYSADWLNEHIDSIQCSE